MLRTILFLFFFVPVNFALGYLIAVRLGLAPPSIRDAIGEVRAIAVQVWRWSSPFIGKVRERIATLRTRLTPILAYVESIWIGYVERIQQLKDRLIPKKKKADVDIGAKDLIVEPTLAEAVARCESTPVFEQIADKIRMSTADANAAAGGKWGDGGGKGGAFMVKKRRLEQLRTGQHLIEMDKRIRSLYKTPDTEEFLRLVAEFGEDGKQIEALLASLIREVKARAPYAGGKLNETVTRLDALHEETTPPLTRLIAEVTKIEVATKPASEATPATPPADSAEAEVGAEPKQSPSIPAETILQSLETLAPLFDTLILLRHQIRDMQAEINTLYARLDTNFEELKPEELVNAHFNLNNRLGIESTLADWWRTNVPATGRLVFVLIDLCETKQLNEQLSIAVVDRIYRMLGRELRVAFPQPTTLTGLFSGHCLCLATRHLSLDEMRIKIQKWHTRIEDTPVIWSRDDDAKGELKPMVTISLVGVGAKQSEADIYTRAKNGLTAAKTAAKAAGTGSLFVTTPDATEAVALAAAATANPVATTPFVLNSLEMWEEIDATSAKLIANPQDTSLLIHRAAIALRIERSDIAESDLAQAIETEPNKIVHYINRGIFQRWRKKYHEAIEDFNKVFTLQEPHATALKHRAITYSLDGNQEAATTDYKTLLELVPATTDAKKV